MGLVDGGFFIKAGLKVIVKSFLDGSSVGL